MATAATTYNGTPPNGLYLVIQRSSDGYAWDAANSVLEAYSAGSLSDYSIALTQLGGDLWGATIPATLPAGTNYNFTFYEQAGGSEATTDPVLPGSYAGYWSGNAVGPSASGYVGRYTSYEILVRRFGLANVQTWSNTEGGSTVNDDAIEDAIDGAEDEIDGFFNGSTYAVPFEATGDDLPHTLVEWATILAGFYLYTRRGFSDEKPGNDLKMLQQEAYREMAMYKSGFRTLPGVEGSGVLTSPTAIAPAYDANGFPNNTTTSPTSMGRPFGFGWR